MDEINKSYYAIIPANVRYDKELPANAKLLYGEITALCNEKGYCWAGNDYFAQLYNVSKTSISKWVSALIEKGYLTSELIYKEGTKQILYRYLRIVTYPIEEKLNTPLTKVKYPIKEKLKDNNTLINNTDNNTINNIRERKNFVPPTLEEITDYCKQRNNSVDPKKFFDYYSTGEWKDAKGNKIKNWKQKIITWEGRQQSKKQQPIITTNKPTGMSEEEYTREQLRKIGL